MLRRAQGKLAVITQRTGGRNALGGRVVGRTLLLAWRRRRWSRWRSISDRPMSLMPSAWTASFIEERPGRVRSRSMVLAILAYFLRRAGKTVKALPELRVHRSPTRFLVPDVTVLDQDAL